MISYITRCRPHYSYMYNSPQIKGVLIRSLCFPLATRYLGILSVLAEEKVVEN